MSVGSGNLKVASLRPASSSKSFVYTFTKTTDWETFHAVKQDVLFKIGEIIQAHGAEIAFPTQVMHLTGPTT